jgi:hypothetical protein
MQRKRPVRPAAALVAAVAKPAPEAVAATTSDPAPAPAINPEPAAQVEK